MLQGLGKFLIFFGLTLVLLGVVLYLSPPWSQLPGLKYLGRLPGDIAVKRDGFRFYFPLTTSILISAILSLILFFFQSRK